MNIFWIIAILPAWVIVSLIVIGIIGLLVSALLSNVTFIKQYALIIKLASIVLLVSGVFLQGALSYKESTDKAVAELKVKLAEAEAKSAKVNTQIVTKVLTEKQIIRQKGKTVTEYIDREVVKYDKTCKLPYEVINAHNNAVNLTVDPPSENTNSTGDK